jgi:hypothetical protein
MWETVRARDMVYNSEGYMRKECICSMLSEYDRTCESIVADGNAKGLTVTSFGAQRRHRKYVSGYYLDRR